MIWRALARDDSGQDVVEYALLTAFFGLAALAAWSSIREAIGVSYGATTGGLDAIWEQPPRPGGGTPSGP